MIRVVLTVALAVALLAAVMPALQEARTATTVERLETEADRIMRVAATLPAHSVGVTDEALAARTSMAVVTPAGFAAARIERLQVVDATRVPAAVRGESTTDGVAIVYRFRHGRLRAAAIPPPTDAVGIEVEGGVIPLRPRGETRLWLRLVDTGKPTVRITRRRARHTGATETSRAQEPKTAAASDTHQARAYVASRLHTPHASRPPVALAGQ